MKEKKEKRKKVFNFVSSATIFRNIGKGKKYEHNNGSESYPSRTTLIKLLFAPIQ